jgi:hypothetical protein
VVPLVALALGAVTCLVACLQNFGTFEGAPALDTPDGGAAEDASPVVQVDASPAPADATTDSGAPSGACISAPLACLWSRDTCRSECSKTATDCLDSCSDGGVGDGGVGDAGTVDNCNQRCRDAFSQCNGKCNFACVTCSGSCYEGCLASN